MQRIKHLWGIVLDAGSAIFADTVSDSIGEANDWLTETMGPVILVLGFIFRLLYPDWE